jgi:hypothetical protein
MTKRFDNDAILKSNSMSVKIHTSISKTQVRTNKHEIHIIYAPTQGQSLNGFIHVFHATHEPQITRER